jgi:hypothetical protein
VDAADGASKTQSWWFRSVAYASIPTRFYYYYAIQPSSHGWQEDDDDNDFPVEEAPEVGGDNNQVTLEHAWKEWQLKLQQETN